MFGIRPIRGQIYTFCKPTIRNYTASGYPPFQPEGDDPGEHAGETTRTTGHGGLQDLDVADSMTLAGAPRGPRSGGLTPPRHHLHRVGEVVLVVLLC